MRFVRILTFVFAIAVSLSVSAKIFTVEEGLTSSIAPPVRESNVLRCETLLIENASRREVLSPEASNRASAAAVLLMLSFDHPMLRKILLDRHVTNRKLFQLFHLSAGNSIRPQLSRRNFWGWDRTRFPAMNRHSSRAVLVSDLEQKLTIPQGETRASMEGSTRHAIAAWLYREIIETWNDQNFFKVLSSASWSSLANLYDPVPVLVIDFMAEHLEAIVAVRNEIMEMALHKNGDIRVALGSASEKRIALRKAILEFAEAAGRLDEVPGPRPALPLTAEPLSPQLDLTPFDALFPDSRSSGDHLPRARAATSAIDHVLNQLPTPQKTLQIPRVSSQEAVAAGLSGILMALDTLAFKARSDLIKWELGFARIDPTVFRALTELNELAHEVTAGASVQNLTVFDLDELKMLNTTLLSTRTAVETRLHRQREWLLILSQLQTLARSARDLRLVGQDSSEIEVELFEQLQNL